MFRNKLVCASLIAFAAGRNLASGRGGRGPDRRTIQRRRPLRRQRRIAGVFSKGTERQMERTGCDFCRAVAAAALGDPEKVVFVPLITSARFLALRTGQIDVLARHTTWTLGREVGLGLHFAGILYYDGQGFMVTRKSGIGKIDNLNGATICVETETTSKENLDDYFQARGWKYQPVLVKSPAEAMAAFSAENCRAYTSDRGQLASARVTAPAGRRLCSSCQARSQRSRWALRCSRGDEEWFTLVKWVLFALVAAEEYGITRDNVQAKRQERTNLMLQNFFADQRPLQQSLGSQT